MLGVSRHQDGIAIAGFSTLTAMHTSYTMSDMDTNNNRRTTVEDSPNAEFCDSAEAKHRFGIGRTMLYALHDQGVIRGGSLLRNGANKGKRLWDVASIRNYINSQMKG